MNLKMTRILKQENWYQFCLTTDFSFTTRVIDSKNKYLNTISKNQFGIFVCLSFSFFLNPHPHSSGTLQTQCVRKLPEESCYSANSDSLDLRGDLQFCISVKFPGETAAYLLAHFEYVDKSLGKNGPFLLL